MYQKEREVLEVERNLKDSIEDELTKYQKDDREVKIRDIKLVGEAIWKDKISGKPISEKVFIVEKEIKEIDENGKERITEQVAYYLGNKCIGGKLRDSEILYDQNFENSELDKVIAINKLIERTYEQDIEKNSLEALQKKEMLEVLTAYFGKDISEKKAKKMIEEMDGNELEEIEEEKEEQKNENDLSEKQTEKIKISGIQKVDLNKLVDGKETLGKRLDLQQYDNLYVVYSEKVNEITAGSEINNTTYSLVGMSKNGEARVLNDEFEMDKTVGNSGSRESTKIRANSTATRDNNDVSVYTRKSNGMSIGCENNQGSVNMFLYQKTAEENENVGIQIETSKTPVIPIETREVMNRNKGINQKEKVQDEIEEHTEKGCTPKKLEDFDGKKETSSHEHLSEKTFNDYVTEILNYENKYGEELIKEVFTEREVKDKLIREIEKDKENATIEQIVENVKEEMNNDAEMFEREHKM